ncbi:dodecin family protein [Sulfurovum sp.]|uniref:dodecin family protein n=1 Tax=Sulfurovum sp. TaxID=1969726 RepID=UPI0028681347|nr:dodecin family protein [Sulfurovum sp.]
MSSIVKIIEVIAESEKSWEDAAQNAIKEASKTIKNIKSIYVKNLEAKVADNKIIKYRINAKISFVVK